MIMKKSQQKTTAYLSLGSNVGDRVFYLEAAIAELDKHDKINVTKYSKVYETEPWLEGDHPHEESGDDWYLNQAIEIETTLSPQDLLKTTQEIEKTLGRETKGDLAPRTIDIDILLFDNLTVDFPELQIPHRHMNDRHFVLVPLVEIAPDLKDPVSHNLYSKILENLEDSHKVIPFL